MLDNEFLQIRNRAAIERIRMGPSERWPFFLQQINLRGNGNAFGIGEFVFKPLLELFCAFHTPCHAWNITFGL